MKTIFEGQQGYLRLNQPYHSLLQDPNVLEEYQMQNVLVANACIKRFGIDPYAIARDKSGNILIITKEDETDTDGELGDTFFACYAIGFNTKTWKLNLYRVGTLEYGFSHFPFAYGPDAKGQYAQPNAISVHQLGVHPEFEGLGIGKILLQVVENFAVENKIDTLKLKRLLHFVRLNNTTLPEQLADIDNELIRIASNRPSKLENDPKAISFITRSYFDKNHYFYATNGFVNYEEQAPNPITAHRMLKTNLKKMCTYYGLDSGAYRFKGGLANPRFGLDGLKPEDALWVVSKSFMSPSIFKTYVNPTSLQDLALLNYSPTPAGTRDLRTMLGSYRCEKFVPYTYEDYTKHMFNEILADGLRNINPHSDDDAPNI